MSEFKIKFQQFLSIEPEIGVANVYVVAMFVRDDFYLFHIFLFKKFLLWVDDVCTLLLGCQEKEVGVLGSSTLL